MTRLTVNQFVAALEAEGVEVVKVARNGRGWPNNITAGSFNPHGVMNHHTAMGKSVSEDRQVEILWDGRPGLWGALAHIGLGFSGKAYLVGWDNVNHAGVGDEDVLRAVLFERSLPAPNENNVDGNPNFWGIEVMNNGLGEEYPLVQLQALVKIDTAICRVSGWTERSCIHHREWTNRKIDMSWEGPLRVYISQALALPPGEWKIPGLVVGPPKPRILPNARQALVSVNRGFKYAMAQKQVGRAARWRRIRRLLKQV